MQFQKKISVLVMGVGLFIGTRVIYLKKSWNYSLSSETIKFFKQVTWHMSKLLPVIQKDADIILQRTEIQSYICYLKVLIPTTYRRRNPSDREKSVIRWLTGLIREFQSLPKDSHSGFSFPPRLPCKDYKSWPPLPLWAQTWREWSPLSPPV